MEAPIIMAVVVLRVEAQNGNIFINNAILPRIKLLE